jgi:uncharacterized protein with GYD domain
MATFITTLHFTEQGIKAIRETCDRSAAFKATAKKMGVKVTGVYWTLGDGVAAALADTSTAQKILEGRSRSGVRGRRRRSRTGCLRRGTRGARCRQ